MIRYRNAPNDVELVVPNDYSTVLCGLIQLIFDVQRNLGDSRLVVWDM